MELVIEKELSQTEGIDVQEEVAEHAEVIDFKMVTFTLAGKDYGIDIMDVKEIAKASRFTYVPNAAPFVLGVYNLRGEIIPIIDLRIFFHIVTSRREPDALESLIIVSVGELTFGIVVDSIDKVIGISKKSIQPPHPIFGDINIKYILGVVENMSRLYILLDVQRIFGVAPVVPEAAVAVESSVTASLVSDVGNNIEEDQKIPTVKKSTTATTDTLDISFIADTLKSLKKYYVSVVNEDWITSRFSEWKDFHSGADMQLRSPSEADAFLETFYSPCSNRFWDDAYINEFVSILPEKPGRQFTVWNPGCGLGYETYSLACLLKNTYPNAAIKIYANDMDLLGIANAPNMTFHEEQVPVRYQKYMTKTVDGLLTFSQVIKDMIMFEYHDCTHDNPYPDVDLVVIRDVLSFLPPESQSKILADISEKLKPVGVVVLGANEAMPKGQGWLRTIRNGVSSFTAE